MKVQSTIIAFSGLVSLASALPAVRRDSNTNDPAVEAPNGTPITLTYGSAPTGYDDSDSDSSNSYTDGNDVSNTYGSYDTSSMYDSSYTTSMYDSYNTMTDDATSTSMYDSYNTWTMTDDSTSTTMCDSCDTMTDDATSTYVYQTTSAYDSSYTSSVYDNSYSTWDSSYTADATSTYYTYDSMSTADATDTYYTYDSMSTADATSTYYSYDSMSTADATSTWTSTSSYATYGSGYMPSGYDNCVQQCMASYGPPPSMVTATPSYSPGENDSTGSGATHTVIVAPTQGVLRYVPFAVNASVGDTVRFIWGAGPHTVTQSSEFNLCNATSGAFKSGPQNESFVFDQVVNDTSTVFYYCGIPTHCEKGMFGMINPPNAEPAASTSAQSMLISMAANSSDVSAQWSYTMMNTQNNDAASNWGSNIDISQITNDPEGQLALVQNVMFTRLAIAENPQYIQADGSFNPNIAEGMAVPMDPTKLITNSTSTTPSSSSSSSTGSETSAPSASSTSGASRRVASSAITVFAAVAIAALVL